MSHHRPKWRASRGAPLSPARPFTALGGFFLPRDIAVLGAPGPSGSAPGDKIGTVLATALREGAGILRHSTAKTAKNCGITRHRRAQNPDCSTPT
jgi:hypothetical protein